jgi:ATP-binding cassette subfamily F protein uup
MELFLKPERLGSKILECHYINKSFGDLVLVKDFHYKFNRKDRVGIIGPNGCGKTTFLKMITDELLPDSGKVVLGETVKFGYYTQEGLLINEQLRIIEVVRSIAEYLPLEKGQKLTAETLLERFLFPRSQQQARVSTLSGGERRRLHLLMILMQNPNFLILDEPTNDLDIHTLRVLEDYLIDFPGVLIIVSHDRFFMDKLVDHIFVFQGKGEISDFPGTYSDYRNSSVYKSQSISEKTETSGEKEVSDYEQNRIIKRKIRSLEQKIEKLESRKNEINQIFLESMPDPIKASELSKELKEIEVQLEENEDSWSVLVEEMQ